MHDRRQRVVEYVIGEMSPAEASEFERELEVDQDLAGMVDEMSPVASRLEALPDEAWDQPDPPPLVMPAGIEADTAKEAPAEPAGEKTAQADRSESSSRFRLWRPGGFTWPRLATAGAVGLALLVVGFFAGTLSEDGGSGSGLDGPTQTQTLAMDSLGEAPAGASGQVSLARSTEDPGSTDDPVTLTVKGLKPSPDSEFYELWLLGKEGELVSLGSFRVGEEGQSQIEVPLPVNPGKYEYFDVSIQPENGSPDHSGRSVLRGSTSKA